VFREIADDVTIPVFRPQASGSERAAGGAA
jgi:hypothetical protein